MRSIIFSALIFSVLTSVSNAQITATVSGDAVSIRDANFDWSCGGKFFPIIDAAGDTVTIIECDTMWLTTCTCPFTVTTLVSGLNAGSYTAMVYRQHKVRIPMPVDSFYVSTQFAGSAAFTIGPHPETVPQIQFHQSGCGVGPGNVRTDHPSIPEGLMLESYPNPFNPATVIRYEIPTAGKITLAVYDMSGKNVAVLINTWNEAGVHEYIFEPGSITSGSYVCRLTHGTNVVSTKLLLVK